MGTPPGAPIGSQQSVYFSAIVVPTSKPPQAIDFIDFCYPSTAGGRGKYFPKSGNSENFFRSGGVAFENTV
jgi:hypothetical protein